MSKQKHGEQLHFPITAGDAQLQTTQVTNPDFIGNFIDKNLDAAIVSWDNYWTFMEAAESDSRKISHFRRNDELIETTLEVLAGRAPQTGRLNIGQRCSRLIDMLGATNSLRGAQDSLLLVAARYLEFLRNSGQPDGSDEPFESEHSVKKGFIAFLGAIQSTDTKAKHEALSAFTTESSGRQYVLASTVQEIANAYQASDSAPHRRLGDKFLDYSITLYNAMLHADKSPERFARPANVAAVTHIFDARFAQLHNFEQAPEAFDDSYASLLAKSAETFRTILQTCPINMHQTGHSMAFYTKRTCRCWFATLPFRKVSTMMS